jgi:tRNA nucleotidyltransferase (CCA-adding enzyme)
MSGISLLTGQRIWHELRLYCDEDEPEKDFARITDLGIAGQIHGALNWNEKIEEEFVRFREADPGDYWDEIPDLDAEFAEAEGLLWIWLSSFSAEVVRELGDRLLLPNKTLRCIESLAEIREKLPGSSLKSPSEITFFLEKQPREAVYCYSLFCSDDEQELIGKFISVWQRIHPVTTGDDLLKMGIRPGPQMRQLLTLLRAECIDAGVQPSEESAWIRKFTAEAM